MPRGDSCGIFQERGCRFGSLLVFHILESTNTNCATSLCNSLTKMNAPFVRAATRSFVRQYSPVITSGAIANKFRPEAAAPRLFNLDAILFRILHLGGLCVFCTV